MFPLMKRFSLELNTNVHESQIQGIRIDYLKLPYLWSKWNSEPISQTIPQI